MFLYIVYDLEGEPPGLVTADPELARQYSAKHRDNAVWTHDTDTEAGRRYLAYHFTDER